MDTFSRSRIYKRVTLGYVFTPSWKLPLIAYLDENDEPVISCGTVYHAVAGQRLTLNDSFQVNYQGLVRQYGGMGLKHLSMLHKSPWHINFFAAQCHRIENS